MLMMWVGMGIMMLGGILAGAGNGRSATLFNAGVGFWALSIPLWIVSIFTTDSLLVRVASAFGAIAMLLIITPFVPPLWRLFVKVTRFFFTADAPLQR